MPLTGIVATRSSRLTTSAAFLRSNAHARLLGVIAKLKWISIKARTSACKSEKSWRKREERRGKYTTALYDESVKIEREREREREREKRYNPEARGLGTSRHREE